MVNAKYLKTSYHFCGVCAALSGDPRGRGQKHENGGAALCGQLAHRNFEQRTCWENLLRGTRAKNVLSATYTENLLGDVAAAVKALGPMFKFDAFNTRQPLKFPRVRPAS